MSPSAHDTANFTSIWPIKRRTRKDKAAVANMDEAQRAVHDYGGHLIHLKLDLKLPPSGIGCGSRIRVPGTNDGFAKCGYPLTHLDGTTSLQLCEYCPTHHAT